MEFTLQIEGKEFKRELSPTESIVAEFVVRNGKTKQLEIVYHLRRLTFFANTRELREVFLRLRMKGVPLLSDKEGMYMATTKKEIQDFVEAYERRILKLIKTERTKIKNMQYVLNAKNSLFK